MFPASTPILVVDDSKVARKLLMEALNAMGFTEIVEAGDGAEALDLVRARATTPQPIGLVISDLRMPTMTGTQLVEKLRADSRFKNLPFLVLSVEKDRASIVEAVMRGSSSYLLKPLSREALTEKLNFVQTKHASAS